MNKMLVNYLMLVYPEAHIICGWWTCPAKEKETCDESSAFEEQLAKKGLQ